MACPCCGLVGNLDAWESNVVDFHCRRGMSEHSVTSVRRTKLSTEGWSLASAEPHRTVDRSDRRKVTASSLSYGSHKGLATSKSLQQQALGDLSSSRLMSSQSKLSAKPRARERNTPTSILHQKGAPEKVIKASSSCKHSDILKNYVPELIGAQSAHTADLPSSPHLCRESTASNTRDNHSRIPVRNKNVPDSPVEGGQSGLHDSEESEHKVEGAIYLSSFTFGSTSQLLPLSETNTSGKKALVRQLSSESCISMLSLNCTDDQSAAGCIEPLSDAEASSQDEMTNFSVCFPEARNYLDDEANVAEPCVQFGDARRPGIQLKSKLGTESNNTRPSNMGLPSLVRWKGTAKEKPVGFNLEKDLHTQVRSRKRVRSATSEKHRMGNRKTKRATLNFHTRRGNKGGGETDSVFNLGVGIGVSYMLFANWKEFKRLNMLLERTESLVKEMQQQDRGSGSPRLGCFSSLKTPPTKKPNVQKDEQAKGSQGAGLKAKGAVEPMLKSRNMADLEASLEAELVLMQQNLEAELQSSPGDFPKWNANEPACIADDLSRRCDRAGTSLHSLTNIDVPNIHYAVSPNALDKRLHEVLEAQQEERILHLEAQIEAGKLELTMKEKELQCWKDIAHHLAKLFQTKPVGQTETRSVIDKEIFFLADNGIKGEQDLLSVKEYARQQLHVDRLQQQCEAVKFTESVTATSCISGGVYDNKLSKKPDLACNDTSSSLIDLRSEASALKSTLDWPIGDFQTQLAVSAWKEESAFSGISDMARNCSNEAWADQDVCDLLKGLDVEKMFPWLLYEEECMAKFLHLGESSAVPNNSLQMGFVNEDHYRMNAAKT